MDKKWILGLAGGAIVLISAIVFTVMWVSATNGEARLRNSFEAQIKANQATYDTVWKTIQQKFNVTEEHKKGFVEVMKLVAEGRRGGDLIKFTTESPTSGLPTTLFSSVMSTIEGQRNRFETAQKRLVDIKLQHDNLRTTIPSSWFVGSVTPLELKLVTSTRTNAAFETGIDDDIDLRNKKQ